MVWTYGYGETYEYVHGDPYVVLSPNWLIKTFGLYCLTVEGNVTARITCWDRWVSCGLGRQTVELPLGNSVVLVHPEHSMARGLYRVEMKCNDGTTCDYGVISAVRFEPLRSYGLRWK